jgi:hypothetical protein
MVRLASMDSLVLPTDILDNGQKSYECFDPFVNEDTGEMVTELTAHQIEIWMIIGNTSIVSIQNHKRLQYLLFVC